jgi:hypothetical protein
MRGGREAIEEGVGVPGPVPGRPTFPVVAGVYPAYVLPDGRDRPGIAVMTGCVFPAPLRNASPPEVPGPLRRMRRKKPSSSLSTSSSPIGMTRACIIESA